MMRKIQITENDYFYLETDWISEPTIRALITSDELTPPKCSKKVIPMSIQELMSSSKTALNQVQIAGMTFDREASIEIIFEQVFAQYVDDPDLGVNAIAKRLTQEQWIDPDVAQVKARRHYRLAKARGYATLTNPANQELVDSELEIFNESRVWYREITDGDITSLYIGDSLVCHYTPSALSSAFANAIKQTLQWVTVVFDVFSILCTVFGTFAPVLTSSVSQKITRQISTNRRNFTQVIRIWQQLSQAPSWQAKSSLIWQGVIVLTQGDNLFINWVKAFFASTKWWKLTLYVCSFIASFAVCMMNYGRNIAMKMARLTAQLINLNDDIEKTINIRRALSRDTLSV
ncbi:hypothetical protein [Vibrio sp. WXL210]|uniref:hypothetical protein n=1 Tax=Vibrio sp. WXL210 TaxID=3450709 RepID=UPI003EC56A47